MHSTVTSLAYILPVLTKCSTSSYQSWLVCRCTSSRDATGDLGSVPGPHDPRHPLSDMRVKFNMDYALLCNGEARRIDTLLFDPTAATGATRRLESAFS